MVGQTDVARTADEEQSPQDRLIAIQDDIFVRNLAILAAVSRFAQIHPKETEPPKEWVDELGESAAHEAFAIAKASWLPASAAPAALKIASQTVSNISRAKSAERAPAQHLNVTIVQMTMPDDPPPIFPEIEVDAIE